MEMFEVVAKIGDYLFAALILLCLGLAVAVMLDKHP